MPNCELCEREVKETTKHHLVPKQKGGKHGAIANLCRACHSTLHRTFSNTELAKHYNTISKLQEAEALQKYLKWIKTKKIERLKF